MARIRVCSMLAVCLTCYTGVTLAQEPPSTLTIQPSWSSGQFLAARAPLELTLSRRLQSSDGRLAMLVGGDEVQFAPTQIFAVVPDSPAMRQEADRIAFHLRSVAQDDYYVWLAFRGHGK